MSPRSWFCTSLVLIALLAACQPIRPITDTTPTPDPTLASVPSTTTSGETDCPLVTNQPIDLLIEPKWQTGDARRYRASLGHSGVRNGVEQPTITTSYNMSVTVLEANEDGYIMEWQYIAMLPTPRKIRVEYDTTPFGEIIGLRNLDELQNFVEPFLVMQHGENASATTPSGIESVLYDPDLVMGLIANDVQAYHAVYGLYFTDTAPYFSKEPGYLLPTTMAGINSVTVTPIRYDAQIGCLHLRQQISFELAADAKSDPNSLWQELEEAALRETIMETTINLALDLNTGWLQIVDIERIRVIDGNGQIDHLHLTYVPPAE